MRFCFHFLFLMLLNIKTGYHILQSKGYKMKRDRSYQPGSSFFRGMGWTCMFIYEPS